MFTEKPYTIECNEVYFPTRSILKKDKRRSDPWDFLS